MMSVIGDPMRSDWDSNSRGCIFGRRRSRGRTGKEIAYRDFEPLAKRCRYSDDGAHENAKPDNMDRSAPIEWADRGGKRNRRKMHGVKRKGRRAEEAQRLSGNVQQMGPVGEQQAPGNQVDAHGDRGRIIFPEIAFQLAAPPRKAQPQNVAIYWLEQERD